ncbi:MAG: PAS domain S-box protein [Armatimonadia bacterium]
MQHSILPDNHLDAIAVPLLYKDLEGRVLGCNQALADLLGVERERLYGRRLRELVSEELAEALEQGDEAVLATGEPQVCPVVMQLSGGAHSAILNKSLRLDSQGAVAGLTCLIIDATELRMAQQELYLRNFAIDSSVSAIALSDLDGVFTYVNDAFVRLTGCPKEFAVGRHVSEVAQDAPRAMGIMQSIKETGTWEGDLNAQRRDGSMCWNHMVCSAIKDEHGQPIGMMASFSDVTERRLAREALRKSERQYRELVENANSIILRLDRQGRMTFVNRFAQDFFGYTEEELVGRPIVGTIVPQLNGHGANMAAFVDDLLQDPERYANSENENVTRDGRRVWVSWTNRELLDEDGEFLELLSVGNDITARKEMEQQLRISESALESSINAIGIAGLDGIIQYVNPTYLRLWGTTKDETIGRHISEYMVPGEADDIINAVRTTGTWQGERPAQRKDGTTFHVEVSANVVRNEQGQPICLMASFADTTLRTQVERELKQFKTISDQASYGSVIVNASYGILYCNETYARMHGYERGELLGQSVRLLYPDEAVMVANLERKLKGRRHLVAEPQRRKRKDGSIFPALVNITPLWDDSGKALYSATVMDVTELTEAVEGLAAEKERLAVTLRSISDGVIATDIEGRITLLSAEAEALSGWSRDEAIGRPVQDIYHTRCPRGKERPHPATRVLAEGQALEPSAGLRLRARDGQEREVAETAAPITDAEGRMLGVVLVFRDITEQEQLREAVHQAHKLESLGLLAGGIAHDFNNLLTSLLGQIGLARREAGDAQAVLTELGAAEKVALQARHLSQQLLTFARGGAPVKTPIYLGELLSNTASFALSGSNVAAEVEIAPNLWAVEADEGQIVQVVNNLVINAKQAMPGGGTVRVHAANAHIDAPASLPLAPGKYVEVEVTDQGTGIAPETATKVFDPYYTTKQSGTGLGLTIVYSIIRKHGGHIALQSAPGQGASFRFWLPATMGEVATAPEEREAPRGFGRILVMDDDAFIRKVVSPMLKQLGYVPEVVKSSQEAVAAMDQAGDEPFAAVILDLTIKGGEGGVETLAKLRKMWPQVKALACSGYCNDPVMANYREYGFNGIIVKPYRLQDLAQGLEAVLKAVPAALEAGRSSTTSC